MPLAGGSVALAALLLVAPVGAPILKADFDAASQSERFRILYAALPVGDHMPVWTFEQVRLIRRMEPRPGSVDWFVGATMTGWPRIDATARVCVIETLLFSFRPVDPPSTTHESTRLSVFKEGGLMQHFARPPAVGSCAQASDEHYAWAPDPATAAEGFKAIDASFRLGSVRTRCDHSSTKGTSFRCGDLRTRLRAIAEHPDSITRDAQRANALQVRSGDWTATLTLNSGQVSRAVISFKPMPVI